MARRRLGEVLVEEGVITDRDLQAALTLQQETRQRLGQALLTLGAIDEDRLTWCLGQLAGVSVLNLNSIFIDPKLLRRFPKEKCVQLRVVPVGIMDDVLTVAMVDPFDVVALDQIRLLARLPVRIVVATETSIVKAIAKHHSEDVGLDEVVSRILPAKGIEVLDGWEFSSDSDESTLQSTPEEYRKEAESPPVIRLTNSIIRDAIKMRASDIHIEPMETCCAIRYRIDGLLRNIVSVPQFLHRRTVCRVKIMGRMDIAEHRLPQDGRCRARVAGNEVDLRISTMPSQFGEKIVIRVLNPKEAQVRLDGLGLLPDALRQVEKMLRMGQGIILLTGPTGGGKTSTLYAMINRLKGESSNIVTLEDPIEINIPGVTQTQIHERAGLTFATGFRSVLRQDPDVIMLGEVRDAETAEITFNAAITGHLVLATLHTNDCCSVPVRLTELGVSPFLVTSAVKGIISQRLVRRLCLQCREPYAPDEETRKVLGLTLKEPITLYRAKGCKLCGTTGYLGRVGVFEVLTLSDTMKEMIFKGETAASRLAEQAAREGMRDLMEDGALKVLQGVTSLEEVMRVTPLEERKGLCPQCQHRVERHFLACPFCNFPLGKDRCRTCGKEQDDTWQFCPFCASQPEALPGTKAQALPHLGGGFPDAAVEDGGAGPLRCLQCGLALNPNWETCPLCLTPAAAELERLPAMPRLQPPEAPAAASNPPLPAAVPERPTAPPEPADEPEPMLPPPLPVSPGPDNGTRVVPPRQVSRPRLLVVADDPRTLVEARKASQECGFGVMFACGPEEALRRLSSGHPAGILVEALVAGSDGFEVCRRLRAHPEVGDIPIVLLAAVEGAEEAVKAREAGVCVLSSRPLTPSDLQRALASRCSPPPNGRRP